MRDIVPCYANGWFSPAKESAEFAEKAKVAVAPGFTGLKWDPFAKGVRKYQFTITHPGFGHLGPLMPNSGVLSNGHAFGSGNSMPGVRSCGLADHGLGRLGYPGAE